MDRKLPTSITDKNVMSKKRNVIGIVKDATCV